MTNLSASYTDPLIKIILLRILRVKWITSVINYYVTQTLTIEDCSMGRPKTKVYSHGIDKD